MADLTEDPLIIFATRYGDRFKVDPMLVLDMDDPYDWLIRVAIMQRAYEDDLKKNKQGGSGNISDDVNSMF